jgi:hypothetical protein
MPRIWIPSAQATTLASASPIVSGSSPTTISEVLPHWGGYDSRSEPHRRGSVGQSVRKKSAGGQVARSRSRSGR